MDCANVKICEPSFQSTVKTAFVMKFFSLQKAIKFIQRNSVAMASMGSVDVNIFQSYIRALVKKLTIIKYLAY